MAKSKYNVKVGDKFGHLTVVEILGQGGRCLCECDCPDKTNTIVETYLLARGKRVSCGCVKRRDKPISVGDKINHWTVLEIIDTSNCLCQCDCAKKTVRKVDIYALLDGRSTCCGCDRKRREHGKPRQEKYQLNIGDVFGKLTIEELDAIQDCKYNYLHKCRCECGNIRYVSPWDLVKGNIYACSRCSLRSPAHHESHTRFYRIWSRMKARCSNSKLECFHNYGGRGIKVCERWGNYLNFKDDMYESYLKHIEEFGEKDTTLDRIDVNGDYEFSNCRWATHKEQANNTRKTKYLTDSSGNIKPLYVWADIKGLNPSTLRNRVCSLGWSDEEALDREVQQHGYKE